MFPSDLGFGAGAVIFVPPYFQQRLFRGGDGTLVSEMIKMFRQHKIHTLACS